MIYASSKDRFKRELDGIQVELQATDPTEMGLDVIRSRATWMLSISSATGGGRLYYMVFMCPVYSLWTWAWFTIVLYCIAFENVICNSWIIGYLILVWI